VAFALSGPAAAWDDHKLAHASAPVGIGEAHHHMQDGSVTLEDEDDSSSQNSPAHDHLVPASVDAPAMLAAHLTVALPSLAEVAYHRTSPSPLAGQEFQPQKRPPRA